MNFLFGYVLIWLLQPFACVSFCLVSWSMTSGYSICALSPLYFLFDSIIQKSIPGTLLSNANVMRNRFSISWTLAPNERTTDQTLSASLFGCIFQRNNSNSNLNLNPNQNVEWFCSFGSKTGSLITNDNNEMAFLMMMISFEQTYSFCNCDNSTKRKSGWRTFSEKFSHFKIYFLFMLKL